ncbi:MAG: hypothetical protein AMS25_00130 [Gemmatimonas sp. SM23_52]|nr:MAG: hypothetical protein AMS25_00130 [Gemmatimonas sp. SM23_52]
MIVLLNPRANHGRAAERWRRLQRLVEAEGRSLEVISLDGRLTPDTFTGFRQQGHEAIIAAGGDGTVNAVINALMDADTDRPHEPLALGAIGLGSSNDFHKPIAGRRCVQGAPMRIDVDGARPVDLGKVTSRDAQGRTRVRYFAINASLGVTALGNFLFNHPDRALAWAKGRSVSAAIALAIAEALIRFRPLPLTICVTGSTQHHTTYEVVNLGILKNVHFTGCLRYDTPVTPDDGLFDVNLYEGLGTPGMLCALCHLSRGSFLGTRGSHHWRADHLEVHSPIPIPLETDGEVYLVSEARFEVVPSCLRLCA